MGNISIAGIISGTVVTLLLDLLVGSALMVILGAPLPGPGMSHEEFHAAVTAFTHTGQYLTWSLILGTTTTVAGGYVAGRMGKKAPYLNAALLGGVGVIIGIAMSSGTPLWFNVIAYALTIPAALLGGKFVRAEAANA